MTGQKEASMLKTSSVRPTTSTEHRLVRDRQTDRQTDTRLYLVKTFLIAIQEAQTVIEHAESYVILH